MRIGIGQISNYPGPSPVTLIDGTVISTPETTKATAAQCLPYQCGEDSSNTAALMWCAWWGQSGVKACTDPACAPYQQACVMKSSPPPAVTNAAAAPAVAKAIAQSPTPMPAKLTPQNIVQALPDVTLALQPVQVESCSSWDAVNGWISDNAVLAGLLLAGVFVIAWRQSGGR
jgi:hypothetical protein